MKNKLKLITIIAACFFMGVVIIAKLGKYLLKLFYYG